MKHRNAQNQQGIVSILVTMIMLIVITLIVIGFGLVARRNTREAVDSQLGTQAYNAAESGVNAAQTLIASQLTGGSITPVNSCAGEAGLTMPTYLDTAQKVAYTCVMINPGPGNLQVNNVTQTTATVLHAQSSNGQPFDSLTFQWSPQAGTPGDCNGAQNGWQDYPALTGTASNYNCKFGLLRVDILDYGSVVAAGSNFGATNLANYTDSLYLQPGTVNSASPSLTFNLARKAWQGSCIPAADPTTGALTCTVKVTLPSNSSQYYLRLSTIYEDSPTVNVTGTTGGIATTFLNGQVVIDSTGRAQDQIKRIQVRVPLTPTSQAPAYAVMSNGEICKDLNIIQAPVSWDAGQCSADEPNWPNP